MITIKPETCKHGLQRETSKFTKPRRVTMVIQFVCEIPGFERPICVTYLPATDGYVLGDFLVSLRNSLDVGPRFDCVRCSSCCVCTVKFDELFAIGQRYKDFSAGKSKCGDCSFCVADEKTMPLIPAVLRCVRKQLSGFRQMDDVLTKPLSKCEIASYYDQVGHTGTLDIVSRTVVCLSSGVYKVFYGEIGVSFEGDVRRNCGKTVTFANPSIDRDPRAEDRIFTRLMSYVNPISDRAQSYMSQDLTEGTSHDLPFILYLRRQSRETGSIIHETKFDPDSCLEQLNQLEVQEHKTKAALKKQQQQLRASQRKLKQEEQQKKQQQKLEAKIKQDELHEQALAHLRRAIPSLPLLELNVVQADPDQPGSPDRVFAQRVLKVWRRASPREAETQAFCAEHIGRREEMLL